MSMCSDLYAEETPLGFSKYQLPPTSSEASKQVCGTPKSASALQAMSPLTPAPTMHTEGSSTMAPDLRLAGRRSPAPADACRVAYCRGVHSAEQTSSPAGTGAPLAAGS